MSDRFSWVKTQMPLVYFAAQGLKRSKVSLAINLPLTWETLCFIDAIRPKFPNLSIIPLSSGKYGSLQTGVLKYLQEWGINYHYKTSEKNRRNILSQFPELILDCTFALSEVGIRNKLLRSDSVIIEDTKTGENNWRKYPGIKNPIIFIDNSNIKRLLENSLGIGYSVLTAIQSLGVFLPGKKIGIFGYGYVGSGIARFASLQKSEVLVCEKNPNRRKIASSSYPILTREEILEEADIIITATGKRNIITRQDLNHIKPNAILVNAGGEEEWNSSELFAGCAKLEIDEHITEWSYGTKKIFEFGGGNSLNLVLGISISQFIDTTFALTVDVVGKVTQNLTYYRKMEGKIKVEDFHSPILLAEIKKRFPVYLEMYTLPPTDDTEDL